MAKDSDKHSVLNRRKQELDHALRHGFPQTAVEMRVEKLRAAAIAVLKKHSGPFAHVEGAPGNLKWNTKDTKSAKLKRQEGRLFNYLRALRVLRGKLRIVCVPAQQPKLGKVATGGPDVRSKDNAGWRCGCCPHKQ